MPYILKSKRKLFKEILANIKETIEILAVSDKDCIVAGDLNYLITKILDIYIEINGECYANYNEVMGMLECCKQEYYRKRIAIYEDKKEKLNGKV